MRESLPRVFQGHERVTHPPSSCSISTNVGETPLVVPIWSTKGHLLNGLIEYKAFGFTVSNSENIPRDVKRAFNWFPFAVLEKLDRLLTDLHATRLKDLHCAKIFHFEGAGVRLDTGLILRPLSSSSSTSCFFFSPTSTATTLLPTET